MKPQQMGQDDMQKSFDEINKSSFHSNQLHSLVNNVCKALSASKSFTKDVVVIKKPRPNLLLVTLLNLPGVFQAHSVDQDKASQEKAQDMVKGYILSKRAVVMIIVSAQENYHNDSVISLF